MRLKNNLLYIFKYIFKKNEIIKLTAFVLIFVLIAGANPVFSEEVEAPEETLKPISITAMSIYIPALFLADYLEENAEKLHDIRSKAISRKDAGVPAGQTQKTGTDAAAEAEKSKAGGADSKAGKIAYLTFDDGLDSKVTPQILDILKKYEIKATFFILGNSVEKNKTVLKRLVDEGHNVGNHTYTHKKDIIYTDVKKFSDELARTSKAIYDAVGIKTKLFRPPYGAPYIKSPEYKAALSGYKIVLWNVDSMDSRGKGITSSGIIEAVKSQVKNKRNAIILFHSTSAKKETVKALPEIIEYLIDNGYRILRLE